MTEISQATSLIGLTLAQSAEQIDPCLLPFVLVDDERHANEILARLLEQHALPIILQVAGRSAKSEDLHNEILAKVIAVLRACKAAPALQPITNFSHYVAVLAANVCRQEQRRTHPRRRSLKDALRHTLKQEPRLNLLQREQTQICGLVEWLQMPARRSEKLAKLLSQPQIFMEETRSDLQRLKRADWLIALFDWIGHPLVFDDLVKIVADLQGIKDEGPLTQYSSEDGMDDFLTNLPATGPQPDEEVAWRTFLTQLWKEIEQLPPLQRLAYLLNFTDGEIEWFWFYGIASIRQIGQTLQLTSEQFNRAWVLMEWDEAQRQRLRALTTYDEQFASLWLSLPLNDLLLAALLETTRQNVINLRQAARKRLRRKMVERQAISPLGSHQ
jgi:DNA-directed RNA polymerase specialized sigma24 family protein